MGFILYTKRNFHRGHTPDDRPQWSPLPDWRGGHALKWEGTVPRETAEALMEDANLGPGSDDAEGRLAQNCRNEAAARAVSGCLLEAAARWSASSRLSVAKAGDLLWQASLRDGDARARKQANVKIYRARDVNGVSVGVAAVLSYPNPARRPRANAGGPEVAQKEVGILEDWLLFDVGGGVGFASMVNDSTALSAFWRGNRRQGHGGPVVSITRDHRPRINLTPTGRCSAGV